MGKNYTLYIKDRRFADEENKGGLVNRLLEEHYKLPPLRDKPLGISGGVPDKPNDNKCPIHNTTLALAGHCMVPGCEYGEKNA